MNIDEVVRTVAKQGFTERQARFLVLVARHTGVCVMRQYAAFAGIVFGQKTRLFFAKLERLGWVSTYNCAHNRARIYHLRHRSLYEAIGEPDSRLRRPPAVPRAVERLMVLDAILANPDIIWLATPDEKAAHVSAIGGVAPERMPHVRVRQGGADHVRCFPDRLPIGIHPEGRWVFVALVTGGGGRELLSFAHRHVDLLADLPAWSVRVAVPAHLARPCEYLLDRLSTHVSMSLREETLGHLRWYFEQLHAGANRVRSATDDDRFGRCTRAFSNTWWSLVYRAWRVDGEAALTTVGSGAVREALKTGKGTIEPLVLPHAYGHLGPLVGVA